MDAVWILLAVVVAWYAMSRLMPGMGGG